MPNTMERSQNIEKFLKQTLFWNVLLSILKLTTGIIGASFALISDAINSISDIFATIIGIVGIKISAKKADKNHPYGHEKFESLFAFVLAAIILFTAIEIVRGNVETLIAYFSGVTELFAPNYWAIGGVSVALVIKIFVYIQTRRFAKIYRSPILQADALNHLGDIFSTASGLVAIVGSMLGAPYLDQFGSIIIVGFIVRVALGIAISSINQLVDVAVDDQVIDKIRFAITKFVDKSQIDVLKTRYHGVRYYVDLEISLPGEISLECSHTIAENIAAEIKKEVPDVKRTMVHVNPKVIGEDCKDKPNA